MKGHSPEVVHSNIKELVRAGHDPKQAIAIALANSRKSKMMAEGGMVDDDNDMPRDLYEINEAAVEPPEDISNPEEIAENFDMTKMAMGGMVQPMTSDEPMGAKPTESMPAMDGDKMPMVSKEAMEALMRKKKNRRYGA
jgi:hypothetical protein